jgi:hypothetical protein
MESLGINSNEVLLYVAAIFVFLGPELCRLVQALVKDE